MLYQRKRKNRILDKYQTYNDYLNSPEWKVKRDSHPNKRCSTCGSLNNLQLHHLTYERVGNENSTDLIWLCSKHHALIHKKRRVHKKKRKSRNIQLRTNKFLLKQFKIKEAVAQNRKDERKKIQSLKAERLRLFS